MTILRISEVPAPISYNLALDIWLVNSSGNSYVPRALNLQRWYRGDNNGFKLTLEAIVTRAFPQHNPFHQEAEYSRVCTPSPAQLHTG